MVLRALPAKSEARNGVGAFIKSCTRLDFHYCDWGGSSRGMLGFLKHGLAGLAKGAPSVEMHVSPRPHQHPVIRAHYISTGPAATSGLAGVNGQIRTKAICVRNLDEQQILQKAVLLRDGSAQRNRRLRAGRNVRSLNESVRGVWSGYHGDYMKGEGVWEKMRPKETEKSVKKKAKKAS